MELHALTLVACSYLLLTIDIAQAFDNLFAQSDVCLNLLLVPVRKKKKSKRKRDRKGRDKPDEVNLVRETPEESSSQVIYSNVYLLLVGL